MATEPVRNIDDYPPLDRLLARIQELPHATIIDAENLARQAGAARATNMVIVGAASHWLPVKLETIEHFVRSIFAAKGEKVVGTNITALRAGREAAAAART